MPSNSLSAQAETRPASLACLNCRRSHLKCDGKASTCMRCASRNLVCSYTPSKRGHRRGLRREASGVGSIINSTSPRSVSGSLSGLGPRLEVTSDTSSEIRPPMREFSIQHESDPSALWIDNEQLVNLYYINFHPSHPILLPRKTYRTRNYPRWLKAVVEFIGGHFDPVSDTDTLRNTIERELEHGEQKTIEMVQARLLYTISMCARNQLFEARRMLNMAIEISLDIGLHLSQFASSRAADACMEAESARRTWYELYVSDGCIAAMQRKTEFQTDSIDADVSLPCEDRSYEDGTGLIDLFSRDDFKNNVFAEEDVIFSSFSYRVEAVSLLGRVLNVTGKHAIQIDEVQAIDNAIGAFLHHLPQSKSESRIINSYGELDELLFQTHVIIQYATILLHFPRGDITSHCIFLMDSLVDHGTRLVCPCARQHVHSIKAIDASRSISMLAALRSPVQRHSPFFIHPLSTSIIVQLSTTSIHSKSRRSCLQQHRDRITLMLGVIKSLSRYWPIAETLLRALKKAARAVFQPSPNALPDHRQNTFSHDNAWSSNAVAGSAGCDNLSFDDLDQILNWDPDIFSI